MTVIVDGKEIKVGNDVKVIQDHMPEADMELHLTVTSEGIVLDRFTRQDDSDETGLCLEATASREVADLDDFCK